MPRQEAHRTGRRTLVLVGGKTYAVTIPIEEIRNLGWEKGDALTVRRFKDQLIVERASGGESNSTGGSKE